MTNLYSKSVAERIARDACEVPTPIEQDAFILATADKEFPGDPLAKLAIYGELVKLEQQNS